MPQNPARIDGIQPAEQPAEVVPEAVRQEVVSPTAAVAETLSPAAKRWEYILLVIGSISYISYALWAVFLMMILPSPEASMKPLVWIGIASAVVAAVVLLGFGAMLLSHISQTKVSPKARQLALIKLVVIVVPGLLLSGAMPFLILREPPLIIDITNPASAAEMIAPVSMTFDLTRTVQTLSQRGFRPVQYKWDLNGDRKVDRETLEPVLVATFEREGIYTVAVSMVDASNRVRATSRRFVIGQSVFSVVPPQPVVELPAVFSVAHLFPDPKAVTSVQWDFDGDGVTDETTTVPQASYTYYRTGSFNVSVVVALSNNTQAQYQRMIDVREPTALPFPVKIVTEPNILIGSPPFAALFTIETEEPVAQVQWNFGDGESAEGSRITHTFSRKGSFPVQARVRTQSGTVAELSALVKVVDQLSIPDLSYTGSPKFTGNKIEGEVPLTLDLQPVTKNNFVQFFWEAPGATEVGSTEGPLQAIYRREGTYFVTLIAQDLEDRVLRVPITVTVKPASEILSIAMEPTAGIAPLTVKFDASESSIPGQEITGFIWGFGDSSAKVFGGASTEHTYTRAGTYVIDLTVQTTTGKEYKTTKTLVVRAPLIKACFNPSRTGGTAPLGIEFFDCSTGDPTKYLWDFGDGGQSNLPKPAPHVFEQPGVYTVQLTVTNAVGNTDTYSLPITVE